MSTNHEIEFKQILNSTQYETFKKLYFENQVPFTQTNYYIDTPDFKLKQNHSALRIRVKDDSFEMTLKVPAEIGLTEYNHFVSIQPKIGEVVTLSQLPDDIKEHLTHFKVTENELSILGALTTYRLETQYEDELLVLDHSQYLDTEDYELEFEVTDYDAGKSKFLNLLEKHHLSYQKPHNKVQRFFKRKSTLSH